MTELRFLKKKKKKNKYLNYGQCSVFFFEGLMINILNKVIFGQSDLAIVIIYVHLL